MLRFYELPQILGGIRVRAYIRNRKGILEFVPWHWRRKPKKR